MKSTQVLTDNVDLVVRVLRCDSEEAKEIDIIARDISWFYTLCMELDWTQTENTEMLDTFSITEENLDPIFKLGQL